MLQPRGFQQRSLDALESFLKEAAKSGPTTAFVLKTGRPYRPVSQLGEPPYICLRVPTGGGKTFMACHALGIAAREFIQKDHVVCLWLVPSNTIREQTLLALNNRSHAYRQAVETFFPGRVSIMTLRDALYVQRGTLMGDTVIIVSTLAALRVEDTDGRKIYETSGHLQNHFSGLAPEQEAILERDEQGVLAYSLANVLRLHRPVVIMDEAHNARTTLSFDTLARLSPSCVIEFTATPQTVHKPEAGKFASNVLYQVSAAELKAEQMVKLPIRLRTRPDWKDVVDAAVQQRSHLEALAIEEKKQTKEYIRPVVLLQAQPQSKDKPTLTVEELKKTLLDDFRIPEEQIAIATGATREIDNVDLFDPKCPVRFIITVQALKEGWDCSFAYVLCSVQETHSGRAVEQVLGRIMRLPGASLKRHAELNCSYAFVASQRFIDAANTLKDALLENGFERIEADQLVTPADSELPLFRLHRVAVDETPDFSNLPATLRDRIAFDADAKEIQVTGEIAESDRRALDDCFKTPEGKQAVERLSRRSRGDDMAVGKPSAIEAMTIPALAIRVNGELELFDKEHCLDFNWKLQECDANLSENEFPTETAAGTTAELDVSDAGKVEIHFIENLHQQLGFLLTEAGWTAPALVNWLDCSFQHPDIARTESTLFISRMLEALQKSREFSVDQLAARKFRLRDAIAEKIGEYRRRKSEESYQTVLFEMRTTELEVGPIVCMTVSKANYAPSAYYSGRYRFNKHMPSTIGEMNDEEAECALFIDHMDEVAAWVRNLECRPETSFWLPTPTDKFYPDFVALLADGRYLVVEYKGGHIYGAPDAVEKAKIGDLWADRSKGRCLFVMATDRNFAAIQEAVRPRKRNE